MHRFVFKKERETYVSTLTHDIKTPVIAQIRALELLLNETFGTITKRTERNVYNYA